MRKDKIEKVSEDEGMLPEYDFTGKKGVRGKYYKAYRQGHTVKIEKDDGTVTVQYFTLEDGAVMLEPDLRQYFSTPEAVNSALRSLVALIPAKSPKRKTRCRVSKTGA